MEKRNDYQRKWRKRKAQLFELFHSESEEGSTLESESLNNACSSTLEQRGESDIDVEQSTTSNESLGDDSDNDYGYIARPRRESSDEEVLNDEEVSDEPDEIIPDLGSKLQELITEDSVPHRTANKLLAILREQGHRLPKDARTLLKTPRAVEVQNKCGGQFKHFGLETGIATCIATSNNFHIKHDQVALKLNIDGIPLFKSNTIEFWPILCQFADFEPFIVSLYCGTTKPNPLEDFLADFIEELNSITENGITVKGKDFKVSVRCFICDAPARAMLKKIKGHSGYHACERCTIQGQYEKEVKKGPGDEKKKSGRVVLIAREGEVIHKRSDGGFANSQYPNHQMGESPLNAINVIDIGLITMFVLDYMHLVCLGVVKRTLTFLKQGPYICRISALNKATLSENLTALQGHIPSEFAREPRPLEDLDRWKATEFRQFLLYTGPLVLKDVVKPDVYHHFLTLSVAMSILLQTDSKKRRDNLNYARELLVFFAEESTKLYGRTYPVYNVHSLTHLVDDVRNFNCSLNDISAFPFENYLQQVKKMVRNGRNPIAQVTKRLNEKLTLSNESCSRNMTISTSQKDSCVVLHDDSYAFVKEKKDNGTLLVDILRKKSLHPIYREPCSSLLINVGTTNLKRTQMTRKLITRDEISRKGACLPYKDGVALFPLLHGKE